MGARAARDAAGVGHGGAAMMTKVEQMILLDVPTMRHPMEREVVGYVRRRCGVTKHEAWNAVHRLRRAGLIERETVTRGGRTQIKVAVTQAGLGVRARLMLEKTS